MGQYEKRAVTALVFESEIDCQKIVILFGIIAAYTERSWVGCSTLPNFGIFLAISFRFKIQLCALANTPSARALFILLIQEDLMLPVDAGLPD